MRKARNKLYGNYVTIQMFDKQVMIDQVDGFEDTMSIGNVDHPYLGSAYSVFTPKDSPKLKYVISHEVYKQQTAIEILKSNTELDQAYLSDICNQGLQELHRSLTGQLVRSNVSKRKTKGCRNSSKSKPEGQSATNIEDIDSINHSLNKIMALY